FANRHIMSSSLLSCLCHASLPSYPTRRSSYLDLEVEIDSGPRVRMGPMKVLGLRRVPASLIERYVRYTPGDPYDQNRLDDWQQALQSTRFFRGAFVTLDAEGSDRRDL